MNLSLEAKLAGLMSMSGLSFPEKRRRRDNLPTHEQLRRIAKAQLKRERKSKK